MYKILPRLEGMFFAPILQKNPTYEEQK